MARILGWMMIVVLMAGVSVNISGAAEPGRKTASVVSDACLLKLGKLKVPVAVPAYVPAGFQLTECLTQPTPDDDYRLVFKNKAGDDLWIVATRAEGLGDFPIADFVEAPAPSGFKGTLIVGMEDMDALDGAPAKQRPRLVSQWILDKKEREAFALESHRGVSIQEGLKVLKSLYLVPVK